MRFALSEYSIYLWLLLLLPLVPLLSHFVFGKRLWLSSLLRMAVCGALILALADLQWVRETKDTDVILVVDQSDSLGVEGKHRAWQTARQLATAERSTNPASKRIGIVTFGREALVENPLREEPKVAELPESKIDGTQSNTAKALKFASALFDRVANRRIVLVTDGEATDQDTVQVGYQLGEEGIEVDVARIATDTSNDISVESIDVPTRISLKTPVHFSVRIRTKGSDSKSPNGIRSSPVSGRLVVQRIQGHQTQTIADGPVTLDKDLEVISLRDTPTQGGLAVYEAKFVADDPESDSYQQNNNASGICDVVDEGKILIVTTGDQTEPIQKRFGFLSEHGIHFEVRPDTASFANISDLLQFDAVVLANTPRMETVEGLPLLRYANEQLVDLKTYVHDFGGGLIMTGGPKSMGAGHWMNTPVEEAMPVRFQVDNEKIVSIGALALVIDKSGSMDGDKIAMSVAAAIQAVSMLSDSDYVGIYPFDSDLVQAVPLQKIAGNRPRIQRSIRRIGAGGGTDMTRALDTAYRDLQKNSASLKHVIVLTDGQTAGSNFESLARDMHRRGITTSAVAVGDSTDAKLLQAIARNGNGQFYQVNNPNAIPRIFMKETRMLSKPLVREFESTVPVERRISHEIVQGLPSPPPGIRGLVLTTIRESVLAEQILRSEQPESPNDTLLAAWQFGSGRSAAWTTDLGERWAGAWNDSGGMDPLLVQMLRWVRRQQVNHNHLVRVTTSDNTTRVSLQWDDAIPDVPNAVACMITRIGTDEIHRPAFDRTGPRQFETSLQSLPTGNYALAIDTGGEEGVIVQGFSVRDNQEFITHPNALRDLVEIAGIGSQSATVLRNGSTTSPSQSIAILAQEQRWIDGTNFGEANSSNPNAPGTTLDLFRPTAMKDRSLTSTWPLLLLLAGMLLLAEIAGRKFGWDRWVSADLKPRNVLPRMEADFTRSERSVSRPPTGKPQVALAPEESLTYTGRLLKSKKESQGKN